MNLDSSMAATKETFTDVTLDHASIARSSFSDCTFEKCRLVDVDLTAVDFSDCVFNHCELSLPKLINTGFHGVQFVDCKFVGADFTKISQQFLDLSFTNCLIDMCNFSALKLKKTPFLRCVLRETRFVEAQLPETNFEGSDLEGAVFHGCNLEKANFYQAKNYVIDPRTNKIQGAIFSLPEAISLIEGLGVKLK